jgi:hypothetical protein
VKIIIMMIIAVVVIKLKSDQHRGAPDLWEFTTLIALAIGLVALQKL